MSRIKLGSWAFFRRRQLERYVAAPFNVRRSRELDCGLAALEALGDEVAP